MKALERCAWAKSEIMVRYHDQEWGVPIHDDRKLFEFLSLEGAQAGLSWETILRKRAAYREAFDDFRPEIVAKYNYKKIERLLSNAGIVRNRLKIVSMVGNAKAFLAIQKEFHSFDEYVWSFAPPATPVESTPYRKPPTHSRASDRMSGELRKRGFRFVGSTICYALMQAVGMVNDHDERCFRREQIGRAA